MEGYKKKSKIINAEEEMISARIIGESINLPYLELKCVETAKKIANIIGKSQNKVLIDANAFLLTITCLLEDKAEKVNDGEKSNSN